MANTFLYTIIYLVFLPLILIKQTSSVAQVLIADFYHMPPFIYSTQGRSNTTNSTMVKGMMAQALQEIVTACYDGNTTLDFRAVSYSQGELEGNRNSDFSLPVTRTMLRHSFYGSFKTDLAFIPVFESPGVYFVSASGFTSSGPLMAITSAWPLVLLIFLASSLAGCIIWICERLTATGEFPDRFRRGFGEGLWWALVTMTTVGYGDRKPASFPGRFASTVWILIGLVITSLFTATLTSAFDFEGSEDVEIRGHRVGVVNDSITEEIAYIRGAEPIVYSSAELMLERVSKDSNLQGFLMESMHAQYYADVLEREKILFLQLFPHSLVHGILARDQNETTQACMAVTANRMHANILRNFRKNKDSLPLKTQTGTKSSHKVTSLLGLNVILLLGIAVPLICLIIIIIMVERWYQHTNTTQIQSDKEENANSHLDTKEKQNQMDSQALQLQRRGFNVGQRTDT